MAKIPNPVWAYPNTEVNAAPGGLLIPAPTPPPEPDPVVVEPPE